MTEAIRPDKQPWEVLPITMRFSDNMDAGEVIDKAQSSVMAVDMATGEDVSNSVLGADFSIIESNKIFVTVKGGENGKKYKINFRAYISETKKLEEDLLFRVRD
jgi:uncharacterized surface anchored protein